MSEAGLERTLFVVALLLLLLGHGLPGPRAPGYEPPARDARSLRVVTWNVGSASGTDGAALRDEHVEQIAGNLRALDPDLVLLQEVRDEEQLQRLIGELGGDWESRIARRGTRRVAVLAQRGELRRFRLPPACRPALGVVYDAPGRAPVVAIVQHGDAFSARRRNEQIGTAAASLTEALDRFGPGVGVLAGDLNLDLDLDKRRDLFTDDEYRDVETYNYAVGALADVGLGSGSTAEPDRRLDYILVSPRDLLVTGAGPWKGRRVGDMDHDPVVADLTPVGPVSPGA